jgi:ABC-2 type transport system permease protein
MNRQIYLVARQTFMTHLKTPSFWVMVATPILLPLVILGISVLIATSSGDDKVRLAVVNDASLTQTLKASKILGDDAKITDVKDEQAAKKQLEASKLDGYLTQADNAYSLTTSADGTVKFDQTSLEALLTQVKVMTTASQMNLTPGQVAALQERAVIHYKTITKKGGEATGGESKNTANYAVSMVIGILIFLFLTLYVQMIAQEIANEKSNRIMETLLATTSARVQFTGKVFGIFSLAILQMIIYVIGFAGIYIAFKDNELLKMVGNLMTGIDASFIAIALLELLFGIFGYLLLAAIVASVVNDQSQVNQAVQPITYLSMIGYMCAILITNMPNNLLMKVLSFIPFISPNLMPTRLAIEYATTGEAVMALVLQIAAVLLVFYFGLGIYQRNVLKYSDESVIKQLMASFKEK